MKKDYYVLLLFILILSSHLVSAKTITVNPGDDLDAKIEAANGGDTVLIAPGTYGAVYLENKNYSALTPLVIKADGTGTVIIAAATASSGNAVKLDNCSYIILEGVVLYQGLTGLNIAACNQIIIKNSEIKNTGQGGIHIGSSSTYIDVIDNYIHDLGLINPQWAEGIYVGRGSYSADTSAFPDNCENIWIENNTLHDIGNAEAINIKGECFHVTVKGNTIYNIAPGIDTGQYNQAAITLEGANNSITNSYRITENRDLWVENNEVYNVTGGYSNWNRGIMFGGTGCYIVNNNVHDCDDYGLHCNSYASLDLPVYIYNNTLASNGQDMFVSDDLIDVNYTDPGPNPNKAQNWYKGLKYIIFKCDDLSLSNDEFNANWYLFFDMVRTKGIKANLGLNGKGSDDHEGFWSAVNALEAESYFEMWNHGYDHINLLGETQDVIDAEIIGNQELMEEKMGHGPIAYGAPYNAADINSVTALNTISEMQYVWFFSDDIASSFKGTNLIRNGEVEYDGYVSYSTFLSNYPTYKENAENAGRDYLTLQYHPPWTDSTERAEIAEIVDYCLAEGLEFVTLSEYYEIQNSDTSSATGFSLSDSSITLYPFETAQLTATFVPADVVNKTITWATSDTAIATVSSSGLVTAVAKGSATITVTTEDGGFTANCSVTVEPALDFEGYEVIASNSDGNLPLETRDDDLDTRWSASGDGEWIKFDMQETRTVDNLEIAFFNGDQRTANFDIQISDDGTNWTTLFSGSSSGETLDLEPYDFTNTLGRYIRIVGYGNSSNDWNSITEIKINLAIEVGVNNLAFNEKEIKLYPNPTSNQNFTIDLTEYSCQEEFKISITDVRGSVVYDNNLLGGQLHQIKAIQSTGLFLVEAQLNDFSFVKKLIVK